MKPLRLKMRAFGPFVDDTSIDFARLDRHGPFLIQGATGSGKSTIFEAMTFALFGDAGGGRERGSQDLVSTLVPGQVAQSAAERSVVEFTFTAGGKTYTVTRYPTQRVARTRARGGNTDPIVKQAEASLVVEGGGDKEVVEDVRRVNEAITAAIGCDANQFRQTILLPQGEFRKVVTDPEARQKTLKQIFRTERYAQLTTALKEASDEAKAALEQAQRRLDEWFTYLGAQSVAEVAERRAAIEGAAAAAEARRSEADALRAARTQALQGAEALTQRFAAREALRSTLAQFAAEAGAHEARVAQLAAAERARGLEVALERRDEALRQREQAHGAIPGLSERLTAAERALEAARAALAAERARGDELAALAQEAARLAALRPRVDEYAEARAAVERDDAEQTQLTQRRAALDAQHADLTGRERAIGEERAGVSARALDLDDARARATAAAALRDDLVHLAALEADAAQHEQRVRDLEVALADAVGHATLLDALRHHAPGIVAEALQPGEPCPACGSRTHPAPRSDGDRAALETAVAGIMQRAEERSRLIGLGEQARVQAAALRAARAADLALTPDVAGAEAAFARAEAEADAAKRAADRVRAIDADLERLRREVGEVEVKRGRIDVTASALAATIAARRERLAAIEAELPSDARDAASFVARQAGVRERAEERQRALDAALQAERDRATERDAAAGRLADARTRAQEADAARDARSLEFTAALSGEGFADEAAFAAARLSGAAIAALRGEVERTDQERAAAERDAAALEAELAGRDLPDTARLEAERAEAHAAWQAADEAYVRLAQQRDAARRGEEEVARLAPEVARLRERSVAAKRLHDSARGQVTGTARLSLENYALEILFEAVLEQSNHHLLQMTRSVGGHAGPYTLRLPAERASSDRALDLEVIDHGSDGVRRPAKTLSGGEGFMAALALALGLAEATARERYPIDALFIDEGFGTLDQLSLAKVVDTLRHLPQFTNRMVGIISHVEELKRLIPMHLLVERTEGGPSRLRVEVNG